MVWTGGTLLSHATTSAQGTELNFVAKLTVRAMMMPTDILVRVSWGPLATFAVTEAR